MRIVLSRGPSRSRYFIVGEAPGREELRQNKPFVGPSGKLLMEYLHNSSGINPDSCYFTNVCKEYRDDNPDPTPEQISDWTPYLLQELSEVQPEIILCIGRFAARWFLGDDIPEMEIIHGMAHRSSRHDLPESALNSIIIPLLHPAGGLWNYERKSIIRYGYELVAWHLDRLNKNLPIHYRHDPYAGQEDYIDATGEGLEAGINSIRDRIEIVGLDTEGRPGNPWSIQISFKPGTGVLLRRSQPDFERGIAALDKLFKRDLPMISMHAASTPIFSCYDVIMCREMGLELQGLPWFDTMYFAYLLRMESQSNKTLCERWQGMRMEDYEALIGNIGRDKQVDYLYQAYKISSSFSKPPKREEKKNTGLLKVSQPKHIHPSIDRVLSDITNNKQTKDGPVNPLSRWEGLSESNPTQVREIESILGPMPEGSLDDIPLEKSLFYSCRDADGTLRNALTFIEMSRFDFPRNSS